MKTSTGRIRSIRSKDDPEKPSTKAFREGVAARKVGNLRMIPDRYDLTNPYGEYLAGFWLDGYDQARKEEEGNER